VASNDTLSRALGSLRRFQSGFTTGQKAVVLVGLAIVVALALVVSSLTSKPTYGVLFSNLSGQDAGAITAKLQTAGVPYQLADGGSVIMVPSSMVDQERIALAQDGLPANSTVGLSLLSNVGITTSQVTQQAEYQEALQGQLAQTIEAINGVQSAQVNLALPPTDVFAVNDNQAPSASVIVQLANGVSLSADQVQAIVHLVASAIPGMSASNVTVVDQYGDVLAAPGQQASGAGTTSAAEAFDAEMEASLQSMLTSILGPNQANVRVSATLNPNQTTTKSEQIPLVKGKPNQVVTQSNTQSQTFTGAGALAGGTLGAIAPAAGTNQNSKYTQTTTSNTYAVGQVDQTTVQPAGTLQRLSVAVAVNSKLKSKVSLASLKKMITAAAGIVPGRGDTLSVVALPFSASTPTGHAAASSMLPMAFEIGKVALLVIGVILAILLMARASGREQVEPLMLDGLVPAGALAASPEATQEMPVALSMPPAQPIIAADVLDFVDHQPEDVAKLLRIWMNARGRK
jgi:flagellar M-ring protein FliF